MNEDPLEAIEIAVMLAEQAGTGVTLTPAQGRWLLDEIQRIKSEYWYCREDVDIWRGQVDAMHAELDKLGAPNAVPEGDSLMRSLSAVERLRYRLDFTTRLD